MEPPCTLLQVKETMTWVAVRKLEQGSGQAECSMISDGGNVLADSTVTLPLVRLHHGPARRDLNVLSRRTLTGYFNKGKDFAYNKLSILNPV